MKRNKIITLILVIFVFGISVAYAADIILSEEVYFDNKNTNLSSTNVQDAIDEINEKVLLTKSCSSDVEEPKVSDGLIPVTIANDGTVTYADTSKKWYDYCNKVWANAVILEDGVSYNVGDTIKEDDIQSYFVWIPKYKYKLWNVDTPIKTAHEIEIIFDTKDTTDVEGVSCKTPMTSGESGNCKNGEYMTHPAFISMGVNGFWVGKFETGYKGATSTAAAQVNSNDTSKVIIKPNVYSWRNITVKNIFETSYNYKRDANSHMMKNTEWGAVTYLSRSKYGINEEVKINNNSSYKTGYSALPMTNQQTYPGDSGDGASYNSLYNTEVGYLASTTGTISGIYDMSGGAHEYVAAYTSENVGSSGFTTTTIANYDAKYFDVYNASSSISSYEYKILGDATSEMGPFKCFLDADNASRWHNSWYGDDSNFIDISNPWFIRGGLYNNGVLAGQFYFDRYTGGVYLNLGFRIVLSP